MEEILELTGLDAAERERRMQFLDFGPADHARLARAASFIESIADGMVEVFYERILAYPATASFLTDPALVARLKAAQRRHFIELCNGPYDAAYFESRLRVGLAHARIRLDPYLYLGGYLIQIEYTRQRFHKEFGGDPALSEAFLRSFGKVIMLDIALATDAYIYGGFVERTTADSQAYEAALAQEALETKKREEEKREELLRMVVHDIRSPVAAIMATARAAMRRHRDLSESPGKQFSLVEATGQNVLQIIDNMVAHAKAPGGELPVHLSPFDVSEVVSACVAQLFPFAQQTGHLMRVVTLEPVPSTKLDKVLVRRVISNLLMNACRHTPAGSTIKIKCSTTRSECRVVVSDDGPGLPSAVRDSFREERDLAPRTDAGSYVDSGLGLPFCVMACQRMGGRLELENTAQRGSTFVVRLPV